MAVLYIGMLILLQTGFYGTLFGFGWLFFGICGFRQPAFCSLGLAVAFAIGAPIIDSRRPGEAVAALREDDHEPSPPVQVAGVVLLEREPNKALLTDWRAGERQSQLCDALCAAVLFTPGVKAVVLTLSPREPDGMSRIESPATAVYRLASGEADCAGAETPGGARNELGRWPDVRSLTVAWRLAFANGACIVRAPPNVAAPEPDWTIRFSSDGKTVPDEPIFSYSLQRVALARHGAEVARATVVSALVPSRIFALVAYPKGQGSEIGRYRKWNQFGSYEFVAFLKRTTTLGLTMSASSAGVVDQRELRRTLKAALDDPALKPGAAAFGLVPAYLENVGGGPQKRAESEPGDVALIARLIGDRRVKKFDGLGSAIEALGHDAVSLRELISARILSASLPEDRFLIRDLAGGFYGLPAGLFVTTTADEARLLSREEPRRRLAWGLIVRQADKGGSAAPDLVKIIAETFSGAKGDSDRTIEARPAVFALCLLGPAAASSLGAIEALIDAGSVPAGVVSNDNWPIMLLRIGKAPESFAKPAYFAGTEAAFAEIMRQRLNRFEPSDCR